MRFSPSFAGAAVVAAIAAALTLAGCEAAPISHTDPAPSSSTAAPVVDQPRALDEGAFVGVIQYSYFATSWDEDEQLLLDLLKERGFEGDGLRNFGESSPVADTVADWTQRGAAAIVMESERWDEDAASVNKARKAGVRFISYIKPPTSSVIVDVHVGVQDGAYARAQLEALIGMLQAAETPRPWHIANIGTSVELGDGDVYRPADLTDAIDDLIEMGVLADADDVIVHDHEFGKATKAARAATLDWIDDQADLAGIVLADSDSGWLMDSGPKGLPIVGLGGAFGGMESVVRNKNRAVVYASAPRLVEGVRTALIALEDDSIDQLPTLEGDFATPVRLVAVEPVVVAHGNWETALADDETMLGTLKATAGDSD